jgi:molybdopterin-binding protein
MSRNALKSAAGLILAPEALSAVKAATRNQLQRSVNILHGSVLASIGLTIPAVLIIGMTTKRSVTLGIEGGNMPLLLLTLGASRTGTGIGLTRRRRFFVDDNEKNATENRDGGNEVAPTNRFVEKQNSASRGKNRHAQLNGGGAHSS